MAKWALSKEVKPGTFEVLVWCPMWRNDLPASFHHLSIDDAYDLYVNLGDAIQSARFRKES